MAPGHIFEPEHAGGAHRARQIALPQIFTMIAITRPDIVIPRQDTNDTRQTRENIQTCDEVAHPLANIARQDCQIRSLCGDILGQRAQLILAGDTQVQVARDNDAWHGNPAFHGFSTGAAIQSAYKGQKQTTNNKRQTTNDKQQKTKDKRQTTNDKRQTTKLKRGMIIRATIRRYHTTPHRTSATSISHYADPIDSV